MPGPIKTSNSNEDESETSSVVRNNSPTQNLIISAIRSELGLKSNHVSEKMGEYFAELIKNILNGKNIRIEYVKLIEEFSRKSLFGHLKRSGFTDDAAEEILPNFAVAVAFHLKASGVQGINSATDIHSYVSSLATFALALSGTKFEFQHDPERNLEEIFGDLLPKASASPLSAWEYVRRAKLPERAVTYANGGRPGETVLEFFNRFWGPYRDAGVLYQDDIKRLGDPNIVTTVRTYCRRHKVDPNSILPPPNSARIDDELKAAAPGSRDQAILKQVVSARRSKARTRQRRPD